MKCFVAADCFWFQVGTHPGTWGSGRQADEWDPDWAENDFYPIFYKLFNSGGKVSDVYFYQHYKDLCITCFYSDLKPDIW